MVFGKFDIGLIILNWVISKTKTAVWAFVFQEGVNFRDNLTNNFLDIIIFTQA